MARTRKQEARRMIQSTDIPTDKIVPNTWNSNRQSEFMFEKEKASIEEFGFIDPCTVRTHPSKRAKVELIDGEHRLRAAKELGYEVIPCIDLGKLSDARARVLSDILNNLGGEDDPLLKADLLKSVLAADADEILRKLLPYGDDELKALIEVADMDWSSLSTANPNTGVGGSVTSENTVAKTVPIYFSNEEYSVFMKWVKKIGEAEGLESVTDVVKHAVEECFEGLE